MKVRQICVIILFGALVSLNAALPNRFAHITAIAMDGCYCGGVAETHINGNYTNVALEDMGVPYISINGPIVRNLDLSLNPPHNGTGDGMATIVQVGEVDIRSDENGHVTVNPTFYNTPSTTQCSSHNNEQ